MIRGFGFVIPGNFGFLHMILDAYSKYTRNQQFCTTPGTKFQRKKCLASFSKVQQVAWGYFDRILHICFYADYFA